MLFSGLVIVGISMISAFIMAGINIIYDLVAPIIPIVAVVMIIIASIVGFIVAIKNTFSVYKKVYMKKGK